MATKCNTSNLCQWCTFHLNGLFKHLIRHIFFDNLNPSCVVYIVSSCTVYILLCHFLLFPHFRPLYQEEDMSVCLSVIITSYYTLRTRMHCLTTARAPDNCCQHNKVYFFWKKIIPLIKRIWISKYFTNISKLMHIVWRSMHICKV